VSVSTTTLAVPAILNLTLLFASTITLLLPFTKELPAATVILVNNPPSPWKKFAVTKFPKFAFATVRLPDVLNVPVTFTPVPVTTTIFALPAEVIVISPFAVGM